LPSRRNTHRTRDAVVLLAVNFEVGDGDGDRVVSVVSHAENGAICLEVAVTTATRELAGRPRYEYRRRHRVAFWRRVVRRAGRLGGRHGLPHRHDGDAPGSPLDQGTAGGLQATRLLRSHGLFPLSTSM